MSWPYGEDCPTLNSNNELSNFWLYSHYDNFRTTKRSRVLATLDFVFSSFDSFLYHGHFFSVFYITVETISEFNDRLERCINALSESESKHSSIRAGCQLFLRFITLTNMQSDVSDCFQLLSIPELMFVLII